MTKHAKHRQERFQQALNIVKEAWRNELWPWEQQQWFYKNIVKRGS